MTIEEAIKHCEEVAQENEKQFNSCPMKYDGAYANNGKSACKCAEEHRQLAEWLKELKQLREQESCEDAIRRRDALDALHMCLATNSYGAGQRDQGHNQGQEIHTRGCAEI